jgi:hypothetical protein
LPSSWYPGSSDWASAFHCSGIRSARTAREPQIRNREETLSQGYDILGRALDRLGRDALFLADLQSRFGETTTRLAPLSAEIFQSFAASSPDYDQVRWLDNDGNERLRVNRRSGAEPVVVSSEQLQNKADRPYFRDTVPLPLNGLYFSALDLNIDNGVVEVPHLPTLRVASPVFRNGTKQGIIVINYRATRLLERLKRLDRSVELYLMNQAGYWLQGPDAAANWGWQLGASTPGPAEAEMLRAIGKGDRGLFGSRDGVWNYRRFQPVASLLATGEVAERRAAGADLYLLARDSAAAINDQETRGKLILGTWSRQSSPWWRLRSPAAWPTAWRPRRNGRGKWRTRTRRCARPMKN